MNPSGFFEVVSSARMEGKLEVFGFGQHEKAISPGDLVIITTNYLQDGFKTQQIQASLKLRGRDMHLFAAAAAQALALYEENSDWLNKPMSKDLARFTRALLNNYRSATTGFGGGATKGVFVRDKDSDYAPVNGDLGKFVQAFDVEVWL